MKTPKKADIVAPAESLEAALRESKVDTTIWEVEKYNLKSRADGFAHEIYLKKKGDVKPEDWFKGIIAEVARYRKAAPTQPHADSDLLYEINCPDLHLSKMAWGQETGHGDYDTDIACTRYAAAHEDLVGRLGSTKPRLLLPIGNDFFNTDTSKDETAGGTKQDVDTRWQKCFRKGCTLITGIVERLAKTYQIDILIVPGNHDTSRVWYLGEYLTAWFKDDARVNINNAPVKRKHYVFGDNLMLYSHGDEEKASELPLLLAVEHAEAWGRSKHRYVRLGHLHTEIVREYAGVKVASVPSLCSPDAWHASKGYVGNVESAQAFLYHSTKGLLTTHYHNAT